MPIRHAALSLAALTLAACTTTMTHERLGADVRPTEPGLNYFLPRQVYTITATYELSSCPNVNGTPQERAAPLVITQKAALTEASVADTAFLYSIPYDTLTSGWKTTSLTATLYDNQTLHTLGATADDRSAAIVKNVVSTALSYARLQSGVVTADRMLATPMCTAEVYTALRKRKEGREKLLDPGTDEKQRATWIAIIAAAQATLQFDQTYSFDPSTTVRKGEWTPPAHKLRAWIHDGTGIKAASAVDRAAYQATLTTSARVLGASPVVSPLPDDWAGRGVMYREPARVAVEVCAGSCDLDASLRLARIDSWAGQFGRPMVFPLKNGPFEKNNLSVSFATNGRLESFSYGSESRLERISASVAENATAVEGYVQARRTASEAERVAAEGAELAALREEAALLEARAKLIEARNKLIDLGEQP